MTRKIPEGYNTVTPVFMFKNSKKAIEFYQKAFDAQLIDLIPNLDGTGVMHASLKIGDSMIMMGDEMQGSDSCGKSAETLGQCPITLFIYVPDVDSVFDQAVSAGGKIMMPVAEMFWGDRVGQINDPFGYSWMIGTHTKDLTNEQIKKQAADFFASMSNKK